MSRPRVLSRIDRLLAVGGIACACASVAFAFVMNLRQDNIPLIVGEEYLGIFGKPNLQPTRGDALAPNASSVAVAPPGVDLTPTGSIPQPAGGINGAAPETRPEFVSVFDGGAWMKSGADFVLVRPGDVVPGLGRVGSIEKIDGQWMVVLDNGAAMAATQNQSSADARFDRSLIFNP